MSSFIADSNWSEYRATKDSPYHISAGCVVYKWDQKQLMFALLLRFRKNYPEQTADLWFLPKGTLGHKETLEQCAERETEEETGLKIEIEQYLGITHRQWTGADRMYRDKITHYFLAKSLGENGAGHDHEYDEVTWFPANDAIAKLSELKHPGEYEIASRAKTILSKK